LECEYFEENISEYLDGVVEKEKAQLLEVHAAICPACSQVLRGVRQIRLTMQQWAAESPSARFQLELTNSLEKARRQGRRRGAHSLALAMALAAALAILLWPEPHSTDYLALEPGEDLKWVRIIEPEKPLADVWQVEFSELAHSPSYSHAQVRPVSF
tara:strand:+ start:438 stop:908 length:471 start_codon:yes stop_codon:yes gene_type:complete